jgi:hypothetical protein
MGWPELRISVDWLSKDSCLSGKLGAVMHSPHVSLPCSCCLWGAAAVDSDLWTELALVQALGMAVTVRRHVCRLQLICCFERLSDRR